MPSTNPVFLWLFLAMRCVFDQKLCASLGQYIIRLTFVFLYFYFSQSSHLISKSYQSVFSIDKYHSISYKKITKSNYMSLQLHWNIHFVMSSRLFGQFYSYLQQKWCKLAQEVSCYYEEDIVGFWTPQYRKKIAKDRNTSLPSRKSMSYQNRVPFDKNSPKFRFKIDWNSTGSFRTPLFWKFQSTSRRCPFFRKFGNAVNFLFQMAFLSGMKQP